MLGARLSSGGLDPGCEGTRGGVERVQKGFPGFGASALMTRIGDQVLFGLLLVFQLFAFSWVVFFPYASGAGVAFSLCDEKQF